MINTTTQLIIGFSVVSAAILWIAYLFFMKDMQKTATGLLACTVLLAALTGLQLEHWRFLDSGIDLFGSTPYVALLLTVPPAFFFFSREVLLPGERLSLFSIVHVVPLSLAFVLATNLIAPVALTIGAGYSIWFARVVFGLRRHLRRFRFEMFFFALFAVLAVLVLILAVLTPRIDTSIFYVAYANFTGIAMILIVATLIIFPEVIGDISEAAKLAYASSTLNDVDVSEKLTQLEAMMTQEKVFQNENLNLSMLAEALQLTGHQLSELINTQYEYGFSRYIREQRVAEAKRLLSTEPAASVLSISLTTGFKSQSNFYAAFREITGVAPGTFRKNADAD